ncbi:glycosyltransferase family 2 protein [Halorientalis salina]|uniref:glycosyltransferase family 2 protein n=1 Tax=Halorientalis salina TaxID=2932266 RepID=UPI00145DFCD6|nr:glycosyltransferase [Halorientalis salina]
MTRVSVVIPTYDRAAELPRAIESVLNQTHQELELLVVDDGSTDGTQSLLDSISDSRLRVITHETNRGANVARNTGIDHAEGECLAFLDSDDEWERTKLDRQLTRYDSGPEDCVAVYCDFEMEVGGLSGRVLSAVAGVLAMADGDRPKAGRDMLVGEILADHLHSGAGSTLLVETAVAREIGGFDEELDWFQDPDFLLRVVQEGFVGYVDEPLVSRHETGSPPAAVAARADEQFLAKHASLVEAAEENGYRVRAAHALLMAKLYLAEGKFETAADHLAAAHVPPRHVPGVLWSGATGIRNSAVSARPD